MQRRYKNNYDRYVRFAPISQAGDYVFLNKTPLFHSAAVRSSAQGYNKISTWMPRPYKLIGVTDSTLQIMQNGLWNTVSIHGVTLSPTQAPLQRKRDWKGIKLQRGGIVVGKIFGERHNDK